MQILHEVSNMLGLPCVRSLEGWYVKLPLPEQLTDTHREEVDVAGHQSNPFDLMKGIGREASSNSLIAARRSLSRAHADNGIPDNDAACLKPAFSSGSTRISILSVLTESS